MLLLVRCFNCHLLNEHTIDHLMIYTKKCINCNHIYHITRNSEEYPTLYNTPIFITRKLSLKEKILYHIGYIIDD